MTKSSDTRKDEEAKKEQISSLRLRRHLQEQSIHGSLPELNGQKTQGTWLELPLQETLFTGTKKVQVETFCLLR